MANLKDIDGNLTQRDKARLEKKYKQYARQSKDLELKNEKDKLNLKLYPNIKKHKR